MGVLLLAWPTSIWSDRLGAPCRDLTAALPAAVCVIAAFLRLYHLEPPPLGRRRAERAAPPSTSSTAGSAPRSSSCSLAQLLPRLSNYGSPLVRDLRPRPGRAPTARVVANSLAVPLLYGTFAPLFGARVALIACLFFAFSPMQLAHARSLIQINLGELFQLAGLCLLVRGVTGGRRWLIGASGAPLALCLYTYHSAKIAPLVAVAYFAAALASAFLLSSPLRRRGVRGIARLIIQIPSIPLFQRGKRPCGGSRAWRSSSPARFPSSRRGESPPT